MLEGYAVRAMKELERDMYHGKIDIRPCRRSANTMCSHCSYGDICLFDPTVHAYRDLLAGRLRRKEAWDRMREIVKGGE